MSSELYDESWEPEFRCPLCDNLVRRVYGRSGICEDCTKEAISGFAIARGGSLPEEYAVPEYLQWAARFRSPPAKKKKIGHGLQKRVWERDKYRCKHCGTHEELCCDHIIPESKGGETSFENLQTLCRRCNSKKGTCDPRESEASHPCNGA